MPKPLCPECGDRHESYQAHVWPVHLTTASNSASNRVSASNRSASNSASNAGDVGGRCGIVGGVELQESHEVGDGVNKVGGDSALATRGDVKQRWSRDAYNAYQREYMRNKRARS
jgi:hypothetical protein